jgi:hypothetical protein
MAHEQWPPWDVTSSLKNLSLLRTLVQEPREAGIGAEPLGWLSRLLVIRSCGYLEQTVVACARGFVEGKAGGLVRSFSLTWLERTRNPSPPALEELAGRFDANLCDDLTRLLDSDDQRLRQELFALVDRRNRIAHGLNEGVNRERSLALSRVSEEVADWWIVSLNPFK